jgi:hypothetical protein
MLPGSDLARAVARMRGAMTGSKLPGIEESTAFGTPSLKVRGKFLMRVKDADTLVFRCPIEMKAVLIGSAPEIYFETDHYKGWPAVLVRLSKVEDTELQQKLMAQYEGGTAAPTGNGMRRRPRKR